MLAAASQLVRPSRQVFATLRAWLQGMPADKARDRFSGPDDDYSDEDPRTTLDRFKKEMQRFATLHKRPDDARALNPSSIEGVGGLQSALEALRRLDLLPAVAIPRPSLTDEPCAWLAPRLAQPLARAGIETLSALAIRIRAAPNWHRDIRGLGKGASQSIADWFSENPHLLAAVRLPATLLPSTGLATTLATRSDTPDIDGSRGRNRAPREDSLLHANTDKEAMYAWLDRWLPQPDPTRQTDNGAKPAVPPTWRAYHKEIERLLLWCRAVRGLAFSSLMTEDATAYRNFILDPPPEWLQKRQRRWSQKWAPFAKPLSPKSAKYALRVINAWCEWLVAKRYLKGNPFAGVVIDPGKALPEKTTKVWNRRSWSVIVATLDSLEFDGDWTPESIARLRFVMIAGRATGLRPHELVSARLAHVRHEEDGTWSVRVTGKGNKTRTVPFPFAAMHSLRLYLSIRGISTDENHWDRNAPLIANLHEESGSASITTRSLLKHIQRFLSVAAERAPADLAPNIKGGTTHWLRHTCATELLENRVPPAIALDILGHASLATLRIYTDTDERLRSRESERVFGEKA